MNIQFLNSNFDSQCATGVSNLDQKFHGLFHFCDIDTCKAVQNNLKKPSVNSLPKQQSSKNGFSILKLLQYSIWRHFLAIFTIEISKLLEDCRWMVFSTDYELFHINESHKSEKVHGTFGLG